MTRLAAAFGALLLIGAARDARADACTDAAAAEAAARKKQQAATTAATKAAELQDQQAATTASVKAAEAKRELRDAQARELEACRLTEPPAKTTQRATRDQANKKGKNGEKSDKDEKNGAQKKGAKKKVTANQSTPSDPSAPQPTAAFREEAQRQAFGADLAKNARDDLAALDKTLKAERAACKSPDACEKEITALETERLAQAVQVLSLSFRWTSDGSREAQLLITSGQYTSDANLDAAVADLLTRAKDRARATALVLDLSRIIREQGGNVESIGHRLTLVSAMDNQATRGELIAHFRRIEKLGGKLPKDLSDALKEAEKHPEKVVDALVHLNAEEAKAVYADLDSLARARQTFKDDLAQIQGRVLVVLRRPPASGCDTGVHFRSALLGYLAAPDSKSTNQVGPSVLEAPPGKYAETLEAATCACRGPSSCPMSETTAALAEEVTTACEAILGVDLVDVGGGHQMRAEGVMRLLEPAASGKNAFKTIPIQGVPFSADCHRDVATDDRAALGFFESLVNELHNYWSAPVRDRNYVVTGEEPSAARAMIVSGLPQLSDSDPSNDGRGKLLAGVDLGMTAVGLSLVGGSVIARYYSESPEQSLDTANVLLGSGLTLLGLVLTERIVSGVSYWLDHRQ